MSRRHQKELRRLPELPACLEEQGERPGDALGAAGVRQHQRFGDLPSPLHASGGRQRTYERVLIEHVSESIDERQSAIRRFVIVAEPDERMDLATARRRLHRARLRPLRRVRAHGAGEGRRAPFLHEMTHELLFSTRAAPASADRVTPVRRPMWFTEGLADYIPRLVADQLGISEEGPFGTPNLSGVDAVCAERARTPDGGSMLPYVGTNARPEVLFTTERARFAPTFYFLFVLVYEHLAERVGLETLIGLFGLTPGDSVARLDGVAGQPLALVVTEWRSRLGPSFKSPRVYRFVLADSGSLRRFAEAIGITHVETLGLALSVPPAAGDSVGASTRSPSPFRL